MSCRFLPSALCSLVPSLVLLSACGLGMQPVGTLEPEGELSDEEAESEEESSDDGDEQDSDESDDDGDDWEDDGDDSSDDPAGQDDGWDQGSDCTIDGFDTVIHQAIQDNQNPDQPLFFYQARTTDTAPFDELRILSYQADPYDGPTGPGSYDLAGMNYADCSLCVLVIENCTDDYMCDKVYFAAEGTLDVERLSMSGGPFIGSLSGVVFQEVTIDADTFESRPVSGGDTWCVDAMDIELPVQIFE